MDLMEVSSPPPEQTPDEQFKRNVVGLRRRNQQINAVTEGAAMGALVDGGEESAAKFLSMHEKIDKLMLHLNVVEKDSFVPYMDAVYEAVATLCDGITGSNQPDHTDVVDRALTIARKGPELAKEISDTLQRVAGSVGPRVPIQLEERRITAQRMHGLK